jgi:peptide/nickel transport system substrate-binding protein
VTNTTTRNAGTPGSFRFSRRSAVLGGLGTLAGATQARRLLARGTATPQASPVASPVATPEPISPLAIIRDQRPTWSGAPVPGGDLRLFTRVEGLDDFSPTAFRQDFQVTVSYLDPLVWLDEVTLEPKPWLAERWEWSDDGLELRFFLRPGVQWQDGSPLTAHDVQFSLLCFRDDYDSVVANMLAVTSDVQAVDDLTLRVLFDEPDGAFVYNAGNLPVFQRNQYQAWWDSRPAGERTLSGFDWKASPPIGTGPWKVETGSAMEMTFARNDRHFAAVPLAERLVLSHQPDPERRIDAWRADQVDLIWPVDGNRVQDLLQEDGFLVAAGSTVSWFAAFNFGNPTRIEPGWMASPGFREALNLAIDRAAYADEVFGGFIDIERAGFMTQPWAIDPSVRNPARNVSEANRLLDEAGWGDWDGDCIRDSPSGDRAALTCIVRDDADAGLLAILDQLNGDFSEIGVALEVQRLTPADFTNRWTSGFDYDLSAWSLSQYGAFAEFDLVGSPWNIRSNPAGWNPGGYWNPEVDEAIFAYFAAWKQDDMVASLRTIQRVTNEDPFALWLGFPQQPVLIRPTISGFQPNRMWQSWNTWLMWRQEEGAAIATPTPLPPTPTPEPTMVPPTPAAPPSPTPDSPPIPRK